MKKSVGIYLKSEEINLGNIIMSFSMWLCWTPDGFSLTNFLTLSLFHCYFLVVLKCLLAF